MNIMNAAHHLTDRLLKAERIVRQYLRVGGNYGKQHCGGEAGGAKEPLGFGGFIHSLVGMLSLANRANKDKGQRRSEAHEKGSGFKEEG